MKNEPYVKKYNKNGQVINPIPSGYIHNFLNRKARREPLQKTKLFGRTLQIIVDKVTGQKKHIYHFRHI
jgi:hypothetical protein